MDLKVDRITLQQFLKLLTGTDDPRVQWQVINENGTKPGFARTWFGPADGPLLDKYQNDGCGVFVCINETNGKGTRTADSIVALRAVFADNDTAQTLADCPLPWSFATITRRGRNPFWLLQPGQPLLRFKNTQAAIARRLVTDAKMLDLARVMRAPGTWHQKAEPIMVTLELGEKPEWRYTIDEVDDAFGTALDTPLQAAERRERKVLKNKTESYAHRLGYCLKKAEARDWSVGQRHGSAVTTATHFRKNGLLSSDGFEALKNLSNGLDLQEINRIIDYTWENVAVDPTEVAAYEGPVDEPAPELVYLDAAVPELEAVPEDPPSEPAQKSGPRRVTAKDVPITEEALRQELMKIVDLSETEARPTVLRLAKASGLTEKRVSAKLASLRVEVIKSGFPIDLTTVNYHASPDGVVYVKERDEYGNTKVNYNEIISPRPIWVSRLGYDVHSNGAMAEIAWQTQTGATLNKWIKAEELLRVDVLQSLDGAPLSAGRARKLTDYLQDVMPLAPESGVRIATSIGWSHDRWVWPGLHDDISTLDESALSHRGTADEWANGLRAMIATGHSAYTGLVAACIAAGAPYSRLFATRNPCMMISHSTSTGKTTLVEYALSLWTDPRSNLIVPAGSTERAVQDIAIKHCDLPLGIDENHLRSDVDKLLYAIGSGQQRKTATRDHSAIWGGKSYWGSAVFCSEHIVNPRNLGARARMFQTMSRPLPYDPELVRTIQRARSANAGAGALRYSQQLALNWREIKDWAWTTAKVLIDEVMRESIGDDATSIAVLLAGGRTLCRTFGLDESWLVPAARWFLTECGGVRLTMVETPEEALRAIVTLALGVKPLKAGRGSQSDAYVYGDDTVLWTLRTAHGLHLDINPASRRVNELLRSMDMKIEEVQRVWQTRGWLEPSPYNGLRHKRRGAGYVIRLTTKKSMELWDVASLNEPVPVKPVQAELDSE